MGWFSNFRDEYIDPLVDNPVAEFIGETILGVESKDKEPKTNEDKLDAVHSFMETQLEESNKRTATRVSASAGNTSVPKLETSQLNSTDLAQLQAPGGKNVDFKLLQEIAARQKRIYSYEQFLISSEQYNSRFRKETV